MITDVPALEMLWKIAEHRWKSKREIQKIPLKPKSQLHEAELMFPSFAKHRKFWIISICL